MIKIQMGVPLDRGYVSAFGAFGPRHKKRCPCTHASKLDRPIKPILAAPFAETRSDTSCPEVDRVKCQKYVSLGMPTRTRRKAAFSALAEYRVPPRALPLTGSPEQRCNRLTNTGRQNTGRENAKKHCATAQYPPELRVRTNEIEATRKGSRTEARPTPTEPGECRSPGIHYPNRVRNPESGLDQLDQRS